jgi:hypothetical protein
MADEDPTMWERIRLRRCIELHECALAALYPQTRLGAADPHRRTEGSFPAPQAPRRKRGDPSPPKNVGMPWKKPWDQ